MSDDLIKREDAINAFKDVLDCDFYSISEETPRERIESIPTAGSIESKAEDVLNKLYDAVIGINAMVDGAVRVGKCKDCKYYIDNAPEDSTDDE